MKGAGNGDVFNEVLTLNADKYLPVDSTLIPTGELKPVKGTPMDFTSPTRIGARFNEVDGGGVKGYDHCYVLNPRTDPLKQVAARVEDPDSGRVLEIFTTEPGIQLYTGNQFTGKPEDGGFKQYSAFCLECQHFPDSPESSAVSHRRSGAEQAVHADDDPSFLGEVDRKVIGRSVVAGTSAASSNCFRWPSGRDTLEVCRGLILQEDGRRGQR